MTRDEIIRIAMEAGAEVRYDTLCVNGKDADDFLMRFNALTAAAEREACAKVCEERHANGNWTQPADDTSALETMIATAGEVMRERCAEACFHQAEVDRIRNLPGVTLEDLQK